MNGIVAQALRFISVGGGATIVHVVAALFLNGVLAIAPLWANCFAFVLAWSVSYWGNWRWTFAAASAHRSAMPRFLALSVCLFGINQAIVYVGTVVLGWPFWASMVLVLLIIPPLGFLAGRLWAFLPRRIGAGPA